MVVHSAIVKLGIDLFDYSLLSVFLKLITKCLLLEMEDIFCVPTMVAHSVN